MPEKTWSDEEIIQIVWDLRIVAGACTFGDLRKATGMSKSALFYRVQRLIDEGRIMQSDTAGSIRTADEQIMRRSPSGKVIDPPVRRRARTG